MKRKMVALLAFSALLMIKPITVHATEGLSAETWLIDIEELQEEQEEGEQQAGNEKVLYGNAKTNPKFSTDGYTEQRQELPTLSGSTDGSKAPKTDDGAAYISIIAATSCVMALASVKKRRRLKRG